MKRLAIALYQKQIRKHVYIAEQRRISKERTECDFEDGMLKAYIQIPVSNCCQWFESKKLRGMCCFGCWIVSDCILNHNCLSSRCDTGIDLHHFELDIAPDVARDETGNVIKIGEEFKMLRYTPTTFWAYTKENIPGIFIEFRKCPAVCCGFLNISISVYDAIKTNREAYFDPASNVFPVNISTKAHIKNGEFEYTYRNVTLNHEARVSFSIVELRKVLNEPLEHF